MSKIVQELIFTCSIKGLFEIDETVAQGCLPLSTLFKNNYKDEFCSVVPLPLWQAACSCRNLVPTPSCLLQEHFSRRSCVVLKERISLGNCHRPNTFLGHLGQESFSPVRQQGFTLIESLIADI